MLCPHVLDSTLRTMFKCPLPVSQLWLHSICTYNVNSGSLIKYHPQFYLTCKRTIRFSRGSSSSRSLMLLLPIDSSDRGPEILEDHWYTFFTKFQERWPNPLLEIMLILGEKDLEFRNAIQCTKVTPLALSIVLANVLIDFFTDIFFQHFYSPSI